MTTLYFESSDEDDLRKTGFSKDGEHKIIVKAPGQRLIISHSDKGAKNIIENYNNLWHIKRAAELTQTMYQLQVIMPESKTKKNILLNMDKEQQLLTKLIAENL